LDERDWSGFYIFSLNMESNFRKLTDQVNALTEESKSKDIRINQLMEELTKTKHTNTDLTVENKNLKIQLEELKKEK